MSERYDIRVIDEMDGRVLGEYRGITEEMLDAAYLTVNEMQAIEVVYYGG